MIQFDPSAADRALGQMIERVRAANKQIVTDAAHLVQANAAIRLHVGYGVRTGTMRRSGRVHGPWQETRDRASASTGPTVIYARRFELGFRGPDSLGRVFPFRPRPYWKPAAEESRAGIHRIAQRRWADAVRGGG